MPGNLNGRCSYSYPGKISTLLYCAKAMKDSILNPYCLNYHICSPSICQSFNLSHRVFSTSIDRYCPFFFSNLQTIAYLIHCYYLGRSKDICTDLGTEAYRSTTKYSYCIPWMDLSTFGSKVASREVVTHKYDIFIGKFFGKLPDTHISPGQPHIFRLSPWKLPGAK